MYHCKMNTFFLLTFDHTIYMFFPSIANHFGSIRREVFLRKHPRIHKEKAIFERTYPFENQNATDSP